TAGVRGFIERMKKRGFSGCIILEQWPQPEGLLSEIRGKLLEMICKPEEPRPVSGDDFVNRIVDANRRFLSWRKRLDWTLDLLTDGSFAPSVEQLIYIAIYLRFIGTGEVPCSEDGGHYRPFHHAQTAQRIFDRLSRIATPENAFIIRKIYPWLPSFGSAFTRAEPLTRIRDIAHRNDIPKELKQEIKHTLQNKLHRSAGPEDLITSEALLRKITAPGTAYSPVFVDEFRRFHEELKEFFNARSLDERLKTLSNEADDFGAASIGEFLEAKEKADTPERMSTAFGLLTGLRRQFLGMLNRANGSKAQQLQLADTGLEDYSFVLLSRLNNHFDSLKDGMSWGLALPSLAQAIGNVRLSGFNAEECRAIESELKNWSDTLIPGDREQLLRLKATLDRSSRLAEAYCNKVLLLFPERAEKLGRALDVAEHAIKVFSEADIRSHPVFQISKLAALLLKNIRTLAHLSSWDVIVPGTASGRLATARGFGDLTITHDEPLIALLERAEGDEEIPRGVAGIVVAHEIPHLSHLAVRARQNRVVFAACEDRGRFAELTGLTGKLISLAAVAEKVSLKIFPGSGEGQVNEGRDKIRLRAIEVPKIAPTSGRRLLSLSEISPATGGAKAAGARRLEELSQFERAGFKAASGLVIPFGVMEESLHAAPEPEKEYRMLAGALDELRHNDFTDALKRLQEIIGRLEVPAELVSGVMRKFMHNERLMVRSSANCEDLEDSAGAGLYDSVANVPPSDVASAILKVWASLWSRRAVINRRNSGIRHDRARMAVLIQRMLVPEFSFVMHTVNPVNRKPDEIYIELAVGMGETLAAAGAPGIPYRMVCNKQTGEVRMLAFASFSQALWPDTHAGLIMETIDYSDVRLSKDGAYRNFMGKRLGAIGQFVENALGCPQDIEGVVSGDEIYLVQSRPQQGIAEI
ncbi:MAG TPA: PEP/pyruvate-binding domain-containing protein, partial [Dissulfurispiraceae bacterium]